MDGDVDYTNYTLQQLREAEAGINRALYPGNFARLQEELCKREKSEVHIHTNPLVEEQADPPPPTVRTAIRLLWGSIAVGVINVALDWRHLSSIVPLSSTVIVSIFSFVIAYWLFHKIFRRRNWARITLLVLTTITLPFAVIAQVINFGRAPVVALMSLVATLMNCAALYLLFTGAGRAWFRRQDAAPAVISTDGRMDYSTWSSEQLREAEAAIDRTRFPVNFMRVQEELGRRGEAPAQPPVAAAVSVAGPPPLTAKRAFWLFAAYTLIQIGVGILGGVVAGFYGAARQMSAEDATTFIANEAIFPIALASMLVAGAVMFGMVRRSFPGSVRDGVLAPLGWTRIPIGSALIACLCGALLAYTYFRVVVGMSPPTETQELGPMATAVAAAVGWPKFVWVVMVLMAAPIEEFLFRGAMFSGLTRSFGAVSAGIIVTALFVAGHLFETRLYYPAIISIAALGLIALAARQLTSSLVAPICVHATYNLVIALGELA